MFCVTAGDRDRRAHAPASRCRSVKQRTTVANSPTPEKNCPTRGNYSQSNDYLWFLIDTSLATFWFYLCFPIVHRSRVIRGRSTASKRKNQSGNFTHTRRARLPCYTVCVQHSAASTLLLCQAQENAEKIKVALKEKEMQVRKH